MRLDRVKFISRGGCYGLPFYGYIRSSNRIGFLYYGVPLDKVRYFSGWCPGAVPLPLPMHPRATRCTLAAAAPALEPSNHEAEPTAQGRNGPPPALQPFGPPAQGPEGGTGEVPLTPPLL